MSAYDKHAGSSKSTISTSIGKPYGSRTQLRHNIAASNLGRSDLPRPTGRTFDTFHTDTRSVNQLDFHDFGDSFEPGHITDDYIGPAMELVRNVLLLQFR